MVLEVLLARGGDEAARVDEPALLAGLLDLHALGDEGGDDHLANARAGLTSAEEEELVLGEGNARELSGAWEESEQRNKEPLLGEKKERKGETSR